MKAVRFHEHGGREVLRLEDVPDLEPGAGEVLVRVRSCALNHFDVDLRENAGLAEQWAYGNRSVLGGLVGAWLGVHVAKRAVGYRLRTGDLFAPAVALGMAVGRVGCLLTELPEPGELLLGRLVTGRHRRGA